MELPVTNLMRRISFTDFLSLPEEEQLTLVEKLQRDRLAAIEAARTVKTGTKSAAKNKAKTATGRKSAEGDQKKLAALLAKLSPEQIAALKENIS